MCRLLQGNIECVDWCHLDNLLQAACHHAGSREVSKQIDDLSRYLQSLIRAAFDDGTSVSNGFDASRSAKRCHQLCSILNVAVAMKSLHHEAIGELDFLTVDELHTVLLMAALCIPPADDHSPSALSAYLWSCLRKRNAAVASMDIFQNQLSIIQVRQFVKHHRESWFSTPDTLAICYVNKRCQMDC